MITGGLITATGNVSGGNLITGGLITATGNVNTSAGISAVGNILSGNVLTGGAITATGAVTSGDITSSGTISAGGNILSSGNVSVGNNLSVTANAVVNGSTVFLNSPTLAMADPIPAVGRGANNSVLSSDDGFDRGLQLYYFNTAERSAFVGYDNSTDKLVIALNVNITNEEITVSNYGNLVTGNIEAITSVTSGNVTGGNVLTSGIVSAAGNITATAFYGNGNPLTNIAGANVVGNVANANTAGLSTFVTGNAQANITSLGTLTGLTVSGNVNMTATSGSFLKLPTATSDPAGAADGSIYFNTILSSLRLRAGGVWSSIP